MCGSKNNKAEEGYQQQPSPQKQPQQEQPQLQQPQQVYGAPGTPPPQQYDPYQQQQPQVQYQQPQPAQPVYVATAPTVVGGFGMFRAHPVRMTCPYCGADIMTSLSFRVGAFALILAGVICLICFLVFFIPLILNSCKDVVHTCPNCCRYLGTYKRI